METVVVALSSNLVAARQGPDFSGGDLSGNAANDRRLSLVRPAGSPMSKVRVTIASRPTVRHIYPATIIMRNLHATRPFLYDLQRKEMGPNDT